MCAKSKMNTRDKLLRKMRKTQLQFDINAYKAKRNEVNIALRKLNQSTLKTYYQKTQTVPRNFGKP